MAKHKHIPFGNGHITWTGDKDPTEDELKAFESMRKLVLEFHGEYEFNCKNCGFDQGKKLTESTGQCSDCGHLQSN